LLVCDAQSDAVLIYAPPYDGAPSATIPVRGECTYAVFDKPNRNLYVADDESNAADVYAYPAGTFEYAVSAGLSPHDFVQGIAVDPPGSELRLRPGYRVVMRREYAAW
jgi:hypothetical protein